MNLIDKDALVEKIERRAMYNHERAYLDRSPSMAGRESEDKDILSLIDTLEMKEVDFEKELDRIWFDNKFGDMFDNSAVDFANVREICRHFFEFGLKAQKGE